MSREKMIHICDSDLEVSRIQATEIVLSRLFPGAEISIEKWIGLGEKHASTQIYERICRNQERFQLLVTNIIGTHFLIPLIQKMPNTPAIVISSCSARKKIVKVAEAFGVDLAGIPIIQTSEASSFTQEGKVVRYADKICNALSELGENHPFYVHPSTYANRRAQENSAI